MRRFGLLARHVFDLVVLALVLLIFGTASVTTTSSSFLGM